MCNSNRYVKQRVSIVAARSGGVKGAARLMTSVREALSMPQVGMLAQR